MRKGGTNYNLQRNRGKKDIPAAASSYKDTQLPSSNISNRHGSMGNNSVESITDEQGM